MKNELLGFNSPNPPFEFTGVKDGIIHFKMTRGWKETKRQDGYVFYQCEDGRGGIYYHREKEQL